MQPSQRQQRFVHPAQAAVRPLRRAAPLLLVLGLGLLLAGCGDDAGESPQAGRPVAPPEGVVSTSSEAWAGMAHSEELILRLELVLADIAFAITNLELPDDRTRKLFWPIGLRIVDIAEAAAPTGIELSGATVRRWPTAPVASDAQAGDLALWRPLLDEAAWVENAKFSVKRGSFVQDAADGPRFFEMDAAFKGLVRLRAGGWSWIRSRQLIRWRLVSGAPPERAESWRIAGWETTAFSRTDAPRRLFREVLDHSLDDAQEIENARINLHERKVAADLLASRAGEPIPWPHPFFAHQANDRHPGVSVVDVDGDGFDDVYVMARFGRNQLFRNRGDGSFEEIAGELGIDVEDHSSSAVFADFDNDGDPDLFLGRTLAPSVYFENVGGRFVDRSAEKVAGRLPSLASSVSAADIDGDGLLDLFVATYALSSSPGPGKGDVLEHLDPHVVDRWNERLPKTSMDAYVNMAGPPNVLLRNRGDGRFEAIPEPESLALYRHSYQATWSDFDGDGDPDVYIANDFAPDNMLRNEGDGRFVDVTSEAGFDHFGLGMSAAWGDFDRDGQQDFYVANMYSSAGSRITAQLDYLDPRWAESAEGNFLYRQESPGVYRKVSGKRGSRFAVQQTGWSWGSQFGDVDNDGYLDLLVLNGFYTAPPEVALAGDT